MKLLNYYPPNQTIAHLGTVIDGKTVDLTSTFPRERPSASADRVAVEAVRYAPPVDERCRIFCVGLNYADHAAENKVEYQSIVF